MNDSTIQGLEEFCRTIRDYDVAGLSEAKRTFVSRNWPMIVALDQLAQADFAAGNYESSLSKLQVLTDLLPESTGMFLRLCRAEIRNNVPGVLEKLVNSAGRLANDNELFDCVDILIGEGRQDLADSIISGCSKQDRFSASIIAASKARVLASAGRLKEGLQVLESGTDGNRSNLFATRVKGRLLEQLLDFEGAAAVGREVSLTWGEEHDLRFALQQLTYTFNFEAAVSLLREFAERHPTSTISLTKLSDEMEAARQAAAAAVAEHGPPQGASRSEIFAALSNAGTPASRILWGKQALIALLRSGALTEADYLQFAWFLPNWEQAAVRHRVLAAAKTACPDSSAVKRGWLHYLITARAYGDAALFCETLLTDAIDEDTLFFLVALVRLQQLAILPPFIAPELFEKLRLGILKQIDGIEAGFRFVMHGNLVELGWVPGTLGPDQIPSHDNNEERGFRRLFAVTTGRLGRVSSNPTPACSPPIRPVLAISGQLRGFENAWPSMNTRLRVPTGAPVVMSVWDKSTNATGRHAGRLERALPPDILARLKPEERYTDTFTAAFPNTSKLLFGVSDVEEEPLRRMIDASGCDVVKVETESEHVLQLILHPHISPNMLKMYYKLARLESLIRDSEWRSGRTFSHVMWIRPDCEIMQLSATDLKACLARTDVVWSSFVTETSFGDYAMVLPRPAFSVLASIFQRVCLAGDSRLLPWRPNRSVGPRPRASLDAFGGPDVIFDMLLAGGYIPLVGIPRMVVKLRAGTVEPNSIRAAFSAEIGIAL
jgi:hypothetical protein